MSHVDGPTRAYILGGEEENLDAERTIIDKYRRGQELHYRLEIGWAYDLAGHSRFA